MSQSFVHHRACLLFSTPIHYHYQIMMEASSTDYEHGKPTEGMCCLCTMEDITEEDQNYGTWPMIRNDCCFCTSSDDDVIIIYVVLLCALPCMLFYNDHYQLTIVYILIFFDASLLQLSISPIRQ